MNKNKCGFLNVYLFLFFFIYDCLSFVCIFARFLTFTITIKILNLRVDNMLYYLLGNFSNCFAGGDWVCILPSPHTHILAYVIPGSVET